MSANHPASEQIRAYYRTLYSAWGRQHWWPAQSRFEVIVGSYLTQNTSWNNVEKALRSLRKAHVLSVDRVRRTPTPRLEKLIRSAGYFRQKAQRLKAFVRFLDERYAGSLTRMFAQPTAQLREELLSLNGIGPETADSILLYAGNHPVFVVDAYTRRILERHEIISTKATYEEIRGLCESALGTLAADTAGEFDSAVTAVTGESISCQQKGLTTQGTGGTGENRLINQSFPRGTRHRPSRVSTARRTAVAQVFNEMHGLMVGVGKNHCQKSQMRCEECPLQKFLPGKP
jgi:endonuclease-3 related protein